jgi:hypothetical protein
LIATGATELTGGAAAWDDVLVVITLVEGLPSALFDEFRTNTKNKDSLQLDYADIKTVVAMLLGIGPLRLLNELKDL